MGNDDDVVLESAAQVNGERAHDLRQEIPGFDKLCECSIGQFTRILHAHARASLDAPESVRMSFCGHELGLEKEQVDVTDLSLLRTVISDTPAASKGKF